MNMAMSDRKLTLPGDCVQKQDVFRVLVTGFGVSFLSAFFKILSNSSLQPYGQWQANPSWLAAEPLHNLVLQTDPATHPRPPLTDDKPPSPLDDKLLVPRLIHISTLQIPSDYQSILNVVPGLHLRPPVLPENVGDEMLRPPENGYDFMLHIGLTGRGPLRLERCGHKLGYNMKDASKSYAPVVIPQPKDFSRRGPDGRPMTIAEKAERDRLASLAAASDIQSNPTNDANARPNRGFGVPYEMFSDELNTELDVTRIIQEMRQTGVEVKACYDSVFTCLCCPQPLQTIYSSMDAGHFVGDFLYYCSLAESKRSANPYEKRRNTHVLFLHCAPVGYPLKSEQVTDAVTRLILWVCNEIQISATDDTPDLPPVGSNARNLANRYQSYDGQQETAKRSSIPHDLSSLDSPPPVAPLPPLPVAPLSPHPPVEPLSPPPVQPPLAFPPPVRPPSFSSPIGDSKQGKT